MKVTAHVVYRLFDRDGVLLYIGSTCDFEYRMKVHLGPIRQYAAVSGAAEIQERYHHHTIERFATKAERIAAERAAIEAEAPELNRQHNPRRWKFTGKAWTAVAA